MKAFLLEFFGLASCLKQSSTVDGEASHANNKRSNRGERQQQHNREVSHTQQRRRRRRRRRPSEEEQHESSYNIAHSSSSKRSLPLIDENSQLLHRSNSSRSGSVLGNNNNNIDSPTQQNVRPLSSGSSSKQSSKISISSSSSGRYRKTQTYHGRDDPATLGLSLSETMGHSHEQLLDVDNDEYEYLEEQSAIRRSYKDQHQAPPLRPTRRKSSSSSRRQKSSSRLSTQHSNNSSTSKRTKLENFIDKQNEDKSPTDTDDVDNVTTISKASINPYSLLNISQSASPRDLYRSYRKKMKETENDGGGEQAFRDVGNAYRRIRAEIERQKRRKVEGEEEQEWGQESRKQTPPPLNKRRSVRNERSRSAKKLPSTKQSRRSRSTNTSSSSSDDEESISSRATAIGARLKDHRELVTGLFANDNKDAQQKSSGNGEVTSLQDSVYSQSQMLTEMNVVPIDAGATNINEKKETIANSCFYLSLAASYLCGVGAFATDPTAIYLKRTKNNDNDAELEIASLPKKEKQLTKKLALQLKRAIEAAVMLVHPDWAESGMVGEEVQAFSDFLVYALDSDSVLGHWSIAVFDEASGFVDVYRGRHYGKIYPPSKVQTRNGKEKLKYKDCDINSMRANTLTLRYIPGHYQPLLPELTKMGNERRKARKEGKSYASGLHKRATLEDILSLLKKWNVLHVVTDGRA